VKIIQFLGEPAPRQSDGRVEIKKKQPLLD
jgi:hypothetical protein